MKTLKDELIKILLDIKNIEEMEINESDNFLEKLDFDSLNSIELITQLNETYNITFGDEPNDFDGLLNFENLINTVSRKLANVN